MKPPDINKSGGPAQRTAAIMDPSRLKPDEADASVKAAARRAGA